MLDSATDSSRSVSRQKTAVERLIDAIRYPERVSDGALSALLRVDGMEVDAYERDSRLVLSYRLKCDESMLPTLAEYAVGRILKEDAALAWDATHVILWQDCSVVADAHALVRLFETFMDSCDWWRARVEALAGNVESSPLETMMIRP